MNKIKGFIIPVSIASLLVVLVGVSFASSQGSQSSNTTFPQKGDIVEQISLSGKFQPKNTLDLGFEKAGKISKIYVKVGDKVRKGQLLAELNFEEVNVAYFQALSDQRVAEAQLAQARDDKDAQKAKLKSVEKSSTANKYDEKAQKEIVNQSDSNIRAKEALLQKAKEAVQNTRIQIDKTKLYAPIDGTIIMQSSEEGEIISSYTSVISLMGDSTLEIQAYVSEFELAKISLGDKAKIKIDSSQTEDLIATVSVIDPVEKNSANVSSYKVTLVPSFAVDKLKSGMMADIILNLGEKKNTLIIPTQSVFEENGKSFVLVIVDGIQVRKEVQLGVSDQIGNNVEILSGIGEQDEIISFNQSK